MVAMQQGAQEAAEISDSQRDEMHITFVTEVGLPLKNRQAGKMHPPCHSHRA
jgi:hypothetical protein